MIVVTAGKKIGMSITFRVGRAHNDLQERIAKLKKLTGARTGSELLKSMINNLEEEYYGINSENEHTSKDKELFSLVNCDYLDKIKGEYTCLERYHKKKTTKQLGRDRNLVKRMCKACQIKSDEIKIKELEREFKKNKMRKFGNFIKIIPQQSRGYLCTGNLPWGVIRFSVDGEHLRCRDAENNVCKISDTCLKRINYTTGKPPCRWLLSLYDILLHTDIEKFEKEDLLPKLLHKRA